ncbi:MAG: helix-turn-helix domain-containing protein [Spirochaetes bacterium]|nr:helix-turn-helix domain-containing protein [Spirochaetota bacterium]
MEIGSHLKNIRLAKKLTLNNIALKLNITASLLSQIENGKITPSLQTLTQLLRYYAINLSDFFKQVEQVRYILQKKEGSETYENGELGLKVTLLASKLQNNALESYIIEMKKDAWLQSAKLGKEINGERIIYVLSGEIETVMDGNEKFSLREGDSLNYKSYVECRITNPSGGMASILISGIPPVLI